MTPSSPAPDTSRVTPTAVAPAGTLSGTIRVGSPAKTLASIAVSVSGVATGTYRFAYSDTDGTFSFTGLPTDEYRVFFQDVNNVYFDGYWPGLVEWESAGRVSVGSVGAAGIDALMEKAGTISGRVTDAATGEPLPGVSLTAFTTSGLAFGGWGWTGSDGRYTVTGLRPGSYTLEFRGPDGSDYLGEWWDDSPTQTGAATFIVKSGVTTTEKNAALTIGSTLSGRIAVAGGGSIPPITVTVYTPDGGYAGYTTSDETGAFAVRALRPGTYAVSFDRSWDGFPVQWWKGKPTRETATPITIVAGKNLTLSTVTMTRGATISGRVTASDTGKPLAGVDVSAYVHDGGFSGRATTDASGLYTIRGLVAGSYDLYYQPGTGAANRKYAYQWSGGVALQSAATPRAVTTSQVLNGVDVVLPKGSTITGTIKDASTLAALGQVTVAAYDADGKSTGWGYSNGNGSYTVAGLPAGSYRLHFDPMAGGFAPQWWSGKKTQGSADPVVLKGATTVTGRNALIQRSATVSGVVKDAAGEPLQGIYVTGWVTENDSTEAVRSSSSGSDGRYSIEGLPPGPIAIGFSTHHWTEQPRPGVYADQFWKNAATLDAATPITLVSGKETTGISATMQAPPKPLTSTPKPTVTGTPAVGSTVYAAAGTWAPAPVTLSYQWLRDGVTIAGATAKSYIPVSADAGARLTVAVTGSKAGYLSATSTSDPSSKVLRRLTATPAPTVSGSPSVGSTLTVQPKTWSPAPVALTFQWLRGGTPVAGATGSTYALKAADAGAAITVRVTGAKSGYVSVTTQSGSVTVGKQFTTAPVPLIAGTAKVGSVLTAKTGTWIPTPSTFTYQWHRGGTVIAGATAKTYTPVTADGGSTLTVAVTASAPGYSTTPSTSKATAAVVK